MLVDADPQGSLTIVALLLWLVVCTACRFIFTRHADIAISMDWQQPDELPVTLSALIPANIELAGLEVALVNSMSREKMLKQVLDSARREYDYILLDCTPSLGMLTVVAPLLWLAVRTMCEFIIISCGDTAINALAAADTTLIPVQAQYLSAKGLEQLLQTIQKVRRQINPKLKIEGILMTMTDSRTNYGREIDALIRQVYGRNALSVFGHWAQDTVKMKSRRCWRERRSTNRTRKSRPKSSPSSCWWTFRGK